MADITSTKPKSIDDLCPEIMLIIAGYLGLRDLQAFIRVSFRYFMMLDWELQSRVVAGGEGLVRACNNRNLPLVTHLLSEKITSYTGEKKITLQLPPNLHQVIFQPPGGGCFPGCESKLVKLAQRGVRLGAKDKEGRLALHHAICYYFPRRHIRKLLHLTIQEGVSLDCADITGRTGLHDTMVRYNFLHCSEELVDAFIKNGVDVSRQDISRRTALHEAICHDAPLPCIMKLLEAIPNPRATDIFEVQDDFGGNTLLHLAADKLNPDLIKLLLPMSSQAINSINDKGNTPLHLAAIAGSDLGSEVDVDDESPPPEDIFFQDSIGLLLKYGANPNLPNSDGETPLHKMIQIFEIDCSKTIVALLHYGANPNISSWFGTPLHYAIDRENSSNVQLLLDGAADVSIPDSRGYTPIHLASMAEMEHQGIFEQLLLRSNIENLNSHTYDDQSTPLHMSSFGGRHSVDRVRRFLLWGADRNARNASGDTALDIASRGNREEIIILLTNGVPNNNPLD